MGQTIRLMVNAAERRLDLYLVRELPGESRTSVQRLIRDGRVSVDGQRLRASAPVVAGMEVVVQLEEQAQGAAVPRAEAIDLDVVFEDEQVLVVNKPAGMVVHPAAGHTDGTLVNALLAHCPGMADGETERAGLVHRLDRDTSGLLVIAKTRESLADLRRQFHDRQVDKRYLALVHGRPPTVTGVVDVPLGRDPHNRKRIAALEGGRASRTRFQVIEDLGDFTLLEVHLETGRTHQIRVHLAWMGIPVVGDTGYGRRKAALGLGRQFLHAWKLAFRHPGSGQIISCEAPLPADLSHVLTELRRV